MPLWGSVLRHYEHFSYISHHRVPSLPWKCNVRYPFWLTSIDKQMPNIYYLHLNARVADWLRGRSPFSTVSLNTPYQILGEVVRNGRSLFPAFVFFQNCWKRHKIFTKNLHCDENGILSVRHPGNIAPTTPIIRFSEVSPWLGRTYANISWKIFLKLKLPRKFIR